jgi:hypothetical protein
MSTLSELQHELADSERHLAEAKVRFARQADLVRELNADGHVRTFPAKRLLVLAQNLNSMERDPDRARAVGSEERSVESAALTLAALLAVSRLGGLPRVAQVA